MAYQSPPAVRVLVPCDVALLPVNRVLRRCLSRCGKVTAFVNRDARTARAPSIIVQVGALAVVSITMRAVVGERIRERRSRAARPMPAFRSVPFREPRRASLHAASVPVIREGELQSDANNLHILNASVMRSGGDTMFDFIKGAWSRISALSLEVAIPPMWQGYKDVKVEQEVQETYHSVPRDSIRRYWSFTRTALGAQPTLLPLRLLDVGCSGGFSTHHMATAFPGVEAIGIDLSLDCLTEARLRYPEYGFEQRNAAKTRLPYGSFDVVTMNFLLYELPLAASQAVLNEAHRLLAPGGIIAILDVNPPGFTGHGASSSSWVRAIEPSFKDGEDYSLDVEDELEEIGFELVQSGDNDPMNKMVLAMKMY